MTVETLLLLIIPLGAGLVMFLIKNIYAKLLDLDVRIRNAITEREVRQIVNDKIDPIRNDINDIRMKLDKLLDLYINDHLGK